MALASSSLRLSFKKKTTSLGINRFLISQQPSFTLGQDQWTFSFTPSAFSFSDHGQDHRNRLLKIQITIGPSLFLVAIPAQSIFILLNSCLQKGFSPVSELALEVPNWIILACLEGIFNNLLTSIETTHGAKVSLALKEEESTEDEEQQPILLGVYLRHVGNEQILPINLTMDETSFSYLCQYWPKGPAIPNAEIANILADIQIVCHLLIGRIRLRRSQFAKLKAGDVISLMLSVAEDGAIPIKGIAEGAFFFRGKIYPQKLVIDMVERNTGKPDDEDDDITFDDDDFDSDWEEFEDDEDDEPDDHRDEDEEENDDDHEKSDSHTTTNLKTSPDSLTPPIKPEESKNRFSSQPTLPDKAAYQFEQGSDILDDVPLKIDLRVCQLRVPLKNFKSFAPGMTIELEQTLPATVDFVIDEKIVAQGELVDVEGTLGVVIMHLGEKKTQ